MITQKIDKVSDLLQNTSRTSVALKGIICFLLGFVFSLGSVTPDLHPFSISFCAVTKRKQLPFAAAGAAAGILIYGVDEYSVRYISAILISCLAAFALSYLDIKSKPAYSMGISFFACVISGIFLNFKSHFYPSQLLLTLGESILCAGFSFFFYRAIHSDYKRLRLKALPLSDISCIVISVSVLLMNLQSIKIFSVSPARLAAIAATLIASRYLGDRFAIMLSLAFGFAFSISDKDMLFLIGALAFSVMTASLFSTLGIYALSGGFLLSFSFFCIVSQSARSLPLFIEALLGVVIFIGAVNISGEKLENVLGIRDETNYDGTLRQSLVLKLRFASSAMAAISESVEQVRDRINEITRRENEQKKSSITKEEYIMREIILEKTNQIRMVASDQFFGVSGMLEDLAFEFDEAEIFNSSASSKIRRLLGEYDIYPQSISAIEDKHGRMRVEILGNTDEKGFENPELQKEIGKICSRYFDKGKITYFKNEAMLSFFEKPNYKLDIGFAQHSAQGRLCGDTIKTVSDNNGHSILIISDGMGKGSRAALDGAMGAGLISKLLNAGFGFDSALKVVNCALLVKSNDESLATLDIANIDLFTGKCEIFKAGAPASYIIKNQRITKCELSSMPAGILRGIEFAKRTAVLRPDDSIVLMSDGISELGEKWISDILSSITALSSQEMAQYIIDEALSASKDKKIDDMSVIYARMERN